MHLEEGDGSTVGEIARDRFAVVHPTWKRNFRIGLRTSQRAAKNRAAA